MELNIENGIVVEYEYDPGEKGARAHGLLVTPDISPCTHVNEITIMGEKLSQVTRFAVLFETKGKLNDACMEDAKEMLLNEGL